MRGVFQKLAFLCGLSAFTATAFAMTDVRPAGWIDPCFAFAQQFFPLEDNHGGPYTTYGERESVSYAQLLTHLNSVKATMREIEKMNFSTPNAVDKGLSATNRYNAFSKTLKRLDQCIDRVEKDVQDRPNAAWFDLRSAQMDPGLPVARFLARGLLVATREGVLRNTESIEGSLIGVETIYSIYFEAAETWNHWLSSATTQQKIHHAFYPKRKLTAGLLESEADAAKDPTRFLVKIPTIDSVTGNWSRLRDVFVSKYEQDGYDRFPVYTMFAYFFKKIEQAPLLELQEQVFLQFLQRLWLSLEGKKFQQALNQYSTPAIKLYLDEYYNFRRQSDETLQATSESSFHKINEKLNQVFSYWVPEMIPEMRKEIPVSHLVPLDVPTISDYIDGWQPDERLKTASLGVQSAHFAQILELKLLTSARVMLDRHGAFDEAKPANYKLNNLDPKIIPLLEKWTANLESLRAQQIIESTLLLLGQNLRNQILFNEYVLSRPAVASVAAGLKPFETVTPAVHSRISFGRLMRLIGSFEKEKGRKFSYEFKNSFFESVLTPMYYSYSAEIKKFAVSLLATWGMKVTKPASILENGACAGITVLLKRN